MYNSCNDTELATLLKEGKDAAFTEIYNRYWRKLYFIAHKLLKSPDKAEEVVQEVFVTFWEKRANLNIQSLPSYLAAMTRYAVYRTLSQQNNYQHVEIGSLTVEPGSLGNEESIEHNILLDIIEKLSNDLPEKCRLVFIRNKLMDQSMKDVASELNISTKTAEAHLTKALKIMRSKLGNSLSILLIF